MEGHSVRRALFVMAHPDDEFGIYGRMLQLRDQGAELWCVWTIGGNPVRDAEAAHAMAAVGVREDRLVFLEVGGLGNAASVERAIKALSDFLEARPCEEIYVTAFEGGHFQHDLTQFATVQAVDRSGAASHVYEFPLYNLAGARVNLFRLTPGKAPVCGLALDRARVEFIRGLTRHYPSQRLVTEGFLRIMPYSRQSQPRWRAVPARDYTSPPHRGLLWHDANPRHGLARSYHSAVCKPIQEIYREQHFFQPPITFTPSQPAAPFGTMPPDVTGPSQRAPCDRTSFNAERRTE